MGDTIHVKLPPQLGARLDFEVGESGLRRSELVRRALDLLLTARERERAELAQRATEPPRRMGF